MGFIVDLIVRFLLIGLAVAFGILLIGCSLIVGLDEKAPPVVRPFEGAPVTAAVDDKVLVIANNTEKTIYHRIFPTDILPVIEWAPCIAPESCPAEQRIDPGGEERVALKLIIRDQTESITVYWWTYLKKAPGASVLPIEMNEIIVPMP